MLEKNGVPKSQDAISSTRKVLGAFPAFIGGVPTTLTRILLQNYRNTNGSRIVIQIGSVYSTFCHEEGILLQEYRNRNGGV